MLPLILYDVTQDGLTALIIAKTKNYKEVEEALKSGNGTFTVDPEVTVITT